MNVSRFRLMIAIVPCLLALRASAQDLYRVARSIEMPRTWTVNASGGADFTNLPPAVLAARSGDVLLVAPGVYSSFTLEGKGLTILGDGGTPTVNGRTSVLSLPADEVVVLRSLKLKNAPLGEEGLRLRDNAGAVWVEDCTVEHYQDWLPTDAWLFSVPRDPRSMAGTERAATSRASVGARRERMEALD